MGTFNWPVTLTSFDGGNSVELEALVDTGASYSVFPATVLTNLGVTPAERGQFEYGDGRLVELDLGQHWITIDGRRTVTWSIFGEDESTFLVGSYTLEGVRLGVDPYSRRLIPTVGLIK